MDTIYIKKDELSIIWGDSKQLSDRTWPIGRTKRAIRRNSQFIVVKFDIWKV